MIDSSDRRLTGFSADGLARRDSMLGELLGELSRAKHRRRTRRRVVGSISIAAVCAAAILLILPEESDTNTLAGLNAKPSEHDEERGLVKTRPLIARVETDAAVRARFISEAPAIIVRMDDETLMEELSAMGQPSGLIRIGGKTTLSVAFSDRASMRKP